MPLTPAAGTEQHLEKPLIPAATTRIAAPTQPVPFEETPHRLAMLSTPAAGNERHLANPLTPPATTRIAAPTRLGRHCNADLLPSAQSRIPAGEPHSVVRHPLLPTRALAEVRDCAGPLCSERFGIPC